MTALDWLRNLPTHSRPWSHESHGPASNSDFRRWLERGSIEMNGERPKPFEDLGDQLDSVVFFPKKPGRVTLWVSQEL